MGGLTGIDNVRFINIEHNISADSAKQTTAGMPEAFLFRLNIEYIDRLSLSLNMYSQGRKVIGQ